jgi:predicted outer membrane repeat protein
MPAKPPCLPLALLLSLAGHVLWILLLGATPSPASATIIQVPSAHATIQAGINAATPGDTVQVAPGTYTGASNRNLDFNGKNILLRSSAGALTTIIDCQGAARGFRFHSGETALAVVQGFMIRNGNAGGDIGGGMSIENASPTVRNCVFTSNQAINGGHVAIMDASPLFSACLFGDGSAINGGGAVHAEGASSPSFLNCALGQNTAPFGGGLHFGGSACSATLTGCTFTANSSVSYGAGLWAHGSALTMKRCTWSENTAKRGAGLYCVEGASAALDSCSFTMNTAGESGGGAFFDNPLSVSVTHTDFTGNRAVTVANQNRGGGLYCNGTDAFLMADCTFTNNTVVGTGNDGGGGGAFYRSGPPVDVVRCTFSGNSAGYGGGAVMYDARLQDCEFTDNTAVRQGGGLSATLQSALIRCTFTRNHATWGGGASAQGEDSLVVQECTFGDNTATSTGGAFYRTGVWADITSSLFHGNSAGAGGAIYAAIALGPGETRISDCTMYDNSAGQGSALFIDGPNPPDPPLGVTTITQCTIANNHAGPSMLFQCPAILSRSIIAFGDNGEAVSCIGNGLAALSCTDVFGNAGGDWTGCIADQLGINGNFSLDPRFCNVGGRDYTLAQTSPCTAANAPAGCGLIGAHPVGCATPIGIPDAGAPAVTPVLRVTPNPVRGSGTIEWSGVGSAAVRTGANELRLYDAGGRLVAQHTTSADAAGRVPWSALVGPSGVPSGVYFLRLAEEGEVAARVRIVVIR